MSDIINSDLSNDQKNSWWTDPLIFSAMDKEFNFYLDAASSDENRLCPIWLTKQDNSLDCDWSKMTLHQEMEETDKTVWINPPYGRGMIKKFMNKCIEQKNKGITSVMLVPATLDAQWLPIDQISEIRIITGGRLSFYHPITNKKIAGNTKGSMFVIFRPNSLEYAVKLIDRDKLIGK